MDRRSQWLGMSISSRFALAAGMLVGLVLSSAALPAHAETRFAEVPNPGTITVDEAAAPAIARDARTQVPHAGDAAGTITTTISSPNVGTAIVGAPVPHAGPGLITTTPATTIPQAAPIIDLRAATAAVLTRPPAFDVTASCAANATGVMTIANYGGDMTVPFNWRLSLNGTPIAQNAFQINSRQSLNINTSGLFGTLTLDVLDTSNTIVASGAMFCQPPPTPAPPSFTVTANCDVNGSGIVSITDAGGSMTVPFYWRVSHNGTPIAQNAFQLNSGESLNISTVGLFGTLTIDVLDTANSVVASGVMFCRPPPPPAPPAFSVSARCDANALGVITITDGGGSMTVPYNWRLRLNGTPIAQNAFQLTAGHSLSINTSGLFGTLTLDVLDPSNMVVASGGMFCPTPPPPPPPSFTVSAACAANATGVITITDVGGNMPVPFVWRLKLNGTPIAQNAFQLNAGQFFTINTSGLFGTLTLDVLDTTNAVVASGSMFCPSPVVPPPPR